MDALPSSSTSTSTLSSHFHRKGTPIFVVHCKCFTIKINSNRSVWNKSYEWLLQTHNEHENERESTRMAKSFWNLFLCICIGHKYIYGWCDDVFLRMRENRMIISMHWNTRHGLIWAVSFSIFCAWYVGAWMFRDETSSFQINVIRCDYKWYSQRRVEVHK